MKKARVQTGVMFTPSNHWVSGFTPTINRNKGIDLLPKNMHHSFLKRFKEWWK